MANKRFDCYTYFKILEGKFDTAENLTFDEITYCEAVIDMYQRKFNGIREDSKGKIIEENKSKIELMKQQLKSLEEENQKLIEEYNSPIEVLVQEL